MSSKTSKSPNSSWRISKACQQCRLRKCRCDGFTPCGNCSERRLLCEYRDKARNRRRKGFPGVEPNSPAEYNTNTNHHPEEVFENLKRPTLSSPSSVTATHQASSNISMQLYYGSTSNFAFMQSIYRDLIASHTGRPRSLSSGGVEDGGAGLDMFQFRSIFFGITENGQDSLDHPDLSSLSPAFVSYSLARQLLQRFLETLYHLMPFQPPELFERQLDALYAIPTHTTRGASGRHIVITAIALAALNTEHYRLADVLVTRVRSETANTDDIVNIETVQISLILNAHFQNERGRPNSAYLELGTAVRKAVSAGFHKAAATHDDSSENIRRTMWCLHTFETLVAFFLGRPNYLSRTKLEIPIPIDPFLSCLVHLSQIMSRAVEDIYEMPHGSFLSMEKRASAIHTDLRHFEILMQRYMGFGVHPEVPGQGKPVCQIILTSLYNQTLLLTYRPFLILRGKCQEHLKELQRERESTPTQSKQKFPAWLNEARKFAIKAAYDLIHHISRASSLTPLVKELRYHGFFIGSAAFALVYDMLHDEAMAKLHLPRITMGLKYLKSMREGEPIASTIRAIESALGKLGLKSTDQEEMRRSEIGTADSASIAASTASLGIGKENRDAENSSSQTLGLSVPTTCQQIGVLTPFASQPSTMTHSGQAGSDEMGLWELGWDIDPSTVNVEEIFTWPTHDPLSLV